MDNSGNNCIEIRANGAKTLSAASDKPKVSLVSSRICYRLMTFSSLEDSVEQNKTMKENPKCEGLRVNLGNTKML